MSQDVASHDENNSDSARILIGVSGGIAAYKIATLVSGLAKHGHDVTVIMTQAATRGWATRCRSSPARPRKLRRLPLRHAKLRAHLLRRRTYPIK